jgi:retinol dehydrogenase-12
MITILKPIVSFVWKTPFYGAQTTLYCTLNDTIECESGNYYSDCAIATPSAQAQDESSQKKLWELSEKLVGLKD